MLQNMRNSVAALGFGLAVVFTAQGSELSLNEYLQQVMKSDPAYQSQVQNSLGSKQTAEAAKLLFRPQFFIKAQFIDDTRTTAAPIIQGNTNIQRNFSVGLRQQTPYGLGVQFSFDSNTTTLTGTDPAFVKNPTVWNYYPVPVFSFSLWQNFWGRADRANQKVMEAQELAKAYGEEYHARATLVEAEVNYWRLAVARAVSRIERESLSRAREFLEHHQGQEKRHLGDPGNLLLAQAAVKGKELELRTKVDEERELARKFNLSRGVDSDEVQDSLELPDPKVLEGLQIIPRDEMRGDVKAAQQGAIAQTAGSDMAREKMLPEVSLYGSIFAWGLNFTVPLDIGTTSTIRQGYAVKAAAADLEFQSKAMQDRNEWKDLVRKFEDAKERLALAVDLEEVQKAKFQRIRKRLALGLTIEDQVFQYELDYLNSSLNRVQIEAMILALRAQMKLYSANSNQVGSIQ
jgi:hypothetical protein